MKHFFKNIVIAFLLITQSMTVYGMQSDGASSVKSVVDERPDILFAKAQREFGAFGLNCFDRLQKVFTTARSNEEILNEEILDALRGSGSGHDISTCFWNFLSEACKEGSSLYKLYCYSDPFFCVEKTTEIVFENGKQAIVLMALGGILYAIDQSLRAVDFLAKLAVQMRNSRFPGMPCPSDEWSVRARFFFAKPENYEPWVKTLELLASEVKDSGHYFNIDIVMRGIEKVYVEAVPSPDEYASVDVIEVMPTQQQASLLGSVAHWFGSWIKNKEE